MLHLLEQLKEISATGNGCTRVAYTEFEEQAFDLVWGSLAEHSHLQRIDDAAGNMFVVPKESVNRNQPVVLIGSHVDTVIEGGWLDGTLGVAAGVHTLRKIATDSTVRDHVGLLVFRDEEGIRFSTGLFGSRVFAGMCKDEDLDVTDSGGKRVRNVVRDAQGCLTYQAPVTPRCFLECHIEQGARLLEADARIGLVDRVVGIRRYRLESLGGANYAGTTDMERRRDALVPVAGIVARLPELVAPWRDAVITCGQLTVSPGAPNVVPGRTVAIVEVRADELEVLDQIEQDLFQLSEQVNKQSAIRGVTVQLHRTLSIDPIPTDESLLNALRGLLEDRGVSAISLPSMAGHDTQNAVRVCPAAMFFIPSIGGLSHCPEENSQEADIRLAGDIMCDWAVHCARAMADVH